MAIPIGLACPEYPLRRSKIERPILPLETLRRDRLLDFLDSNLHRRAIFIVAEAGFGKTTLLADFARRTRFRTVWYRVDDDDLDPITFLRYFMAACRSVEPEMLSRSVAMLAEAATRPLTWEGLLESIISELGPIASEPTIVFFDDYHLAEDFSSIRQIVERLIARAPEQVTFIVAGRRSPNLAVARLRASDALAELGRSELRFGQEETDQLFREVYSQPLEADVLADLQDRTEGWVASLQLVKTAVRGRAAPDVRRFIHTLSASEGELYDYLAEEVLADLPPDTQAILTRVSILDEIEPSIATEAAGITAAATRIQLNTAQRLGLVSRTARALGPARLHPLVREFLEFRLTEEIGETGVRDLHRLVARLYETISWRHAANHWSRAGDNEDVLRVVRAATATILGTGEFEFAEEFIDAYAEGVADPWFDIVRSRVAFGRSDYDAGERLGVRAHALALGNHTDVALQGVVTVHDFYLALRAGDAERLSAAAARAASLELDEEVRAIAKAQELIGTDGHIALAVSCIDAVRRISKAKGHGRYEGIAELNLAIWVRMLGEMRRALEHADRATALLREYGARDERVGVALTRASIAAHLGEADAGRASISAFESDRCATAGADVTDAFVMYGDASVALAALDDPRLVVRTPADEAVRDLSRARALLHLGRFDEADAALPSGAVRPVYCAYRSTVAATRAQLAIARSPLSAGPVIRDALRACESQGAIFWWRALKLMEASLLDAVTLNSAVLGCVGDDRAYLSVAADALMPRYSDLGPEAVQLVLAEAASRPDRWRQATRLSLNTDGRSGNALRVARVLEHVGQAEDIPLLRAIAKSASRRHVASDLGQRLIRSLAPRCFIEDLGPVRILVGSRIVSGAEIRRKVLALMCFLITRPQFTATADQVLDALWPGQDPSTGANSLNQTVYFLRRIFEPPYEEGRTAGYVRHESDLIWLDPELVSSRSRDCLQLMDRMGSAPLTDQVEELVRTYTSAFALDFAYEDWSCSYRDSLHARFLSLAETVIQREARCSAYERAIDLAQRVLQVAPEADQVEVLLLRLYRMTGAHSAAAEQYSHYAAAYRADNGAEPPSLEDL